MTISLIRSNEVLPEFQWLGFRSYFIPTSIYASLETGAIKVGSWNSILAICLYQ